MGTSTSCSPLIPAVFFISGCAFSDASIFLPETVTWNVSGHFGRTEGPKCGLCTVQTSLFHNVKTFPTVLAHCQIYLCNETSQKYKSKWTFTTPCLITDVARTCPYFSVAPTSHFVRAMEIRSWCRAESCVKKSSGTVYNTSRSCTVVSLGQISYSATGSLQKTSRARGPVLCLETHPTPDLDHDFGIWSMCV